MMKNNRRFTRVILPIIKVVMKAADGRLVEALLRNISLCGVNVVTNRTFPIGTKVDVDITIESFEENLKLKFINGRIVRHTGDGMAVEFSRMDIDQFAHLKKLVASRLGNPLVTQEITAFFQKKYTT